MDKHYICTGGCKGVSDRPGICQAEGCANHNHKLVECPCKDGTHFDFKGCVNCGEICQGNCELDNYKVELHG